MNGGVTLGHFLIGVAILDLVVMLPLALRTKRNPDATPEQLRQVNLVIAAVLVAAVALVLIGLFLPDAQMRII